jgi:ribose 5-phosphate isomerase A
MKFQSSTVLSFLLLAALSSSSTSAFQPSSSIQAFPLLPPLQLVIPAPYSASPRPSFVVLRRNMASSTSSEPPQKQTYTQDELKKMVGYKAVDDYVQSDMVIGLGTGSTAYFAVERVGQLLASGELRNIVAIPTSIRTKEQAESLGIPLVTLDTHSTLDVAIDGADGVDSELNLTKGGGGALFREKIVEVCAKQFIVIVDESKIVPQGLGPDFPIPVEIVPFCHEHTMRMIGNLPSCKDKCTPVLRMGSSSNNKVDGDTIAVSDNGNYLVDLHFTEPITDPVTMGQELKNVVGVVEHGLFCNMASAVIIAGSDGIRVMEASK